MIKEFFTLPDTDLTQESSVDPMGIQRIWTSYGQDIFGDKLTTIANDLRIYTFNLFHNYLINQLFKNYPEEIQRSKENFKSWTTDADVKMGLLIFLEDLVTHIFYYKWKFDGENNYGILGMNKVKIVHRSDDPSKIYLAAYKGAGLLKNQINLGMTGRYKGPFMNMEFFDRSFTYIEKTWVQAEKIISRWTNGMQLGTDLEKLIINQLLSQKRRDYPRLSLEEIRSTSSWRKVQEGYLLCFGKRSLPKEIKKFWEYKLGLDSGAPNALFKKIGEVPPGGYKYHYKIFSSALKELKSEPSEKLKLARIVEIEPLLSYSEYLFRYLAQPGISSFTNEVKNIQRLRVKINALGNFSFQVIHPRLNTLLKVMVNSKSDEEWLQGIMEYHRNIMEERGGTAWLEFNGNTFKHYFSPPLSDETNTVEKYMGHEFWYHTYYLETLYSIYQGLN